MTNKTDMLLIYPRPTQDSPVKLAPLSILYPALYLKDQGMKVEIMDQRFDPQEKLVEAMGWTKAVSVSAMTGYQCGQAADLLERAKEINPDVVTAVGGHHAQIMGQQILEEPFVDRIYDKPVYGEHLSLADEQIIPHFQRTEMQYMTSTGCPFGCRFCALSRQWEPKPLTFIESELRKLHLAAPFDWLSFADPNLNHYMHKGCDGKSYRIDNLARMREIGAILRDLGVTWEANLRSPTLDPEMIKTLEWAGCRDIEIGCESGNDSVLRKIVRKGHGVDAIKRACLNLSDSQISTMYSFIAFMPGETEADVHMTMDLIDWIMERDPKARVSIYNFMPYPGTPMYEDVLAGRGGYPKFTPPTNMRGWAEMSGMQSPLYWISGMNFRMDNTRKNFPGEDWKLIEPYIELAKKKWSNRDIYDFPCDEVSTLIAKQVRKFDKQMTQMDKNI